MTKKLTLAEEKPEDELTGASAVSALQQVFLPPSLTLASLTATKGQGGRIVISVSFRKAPWAGYTLRLTRSWAVFLHRELGRVLAK